MSRRSSSSSATEIKLALILLFPLLDGACAGMCKEFGFVHIPKTGGTTIVEGLSRCSTQLKQNLLQTQNLSPDLHHQSAFRQRRRFGAARWDAAYTFSVVRSPFSWAVSMFFYAMETHCHRDGSPKGSRMENFVNKTDGVIPACSYARELLDPSHPGKGRAYHKSHIALFTAWLVEHDELARVTGRPFLTPNLIAIGGLEPDGTQIAWLSAAKGSRGALSVTHVIKLEDSPDFNRHADCAQLEAVVCNQSAPGNGTSPAAFVKVVKASGHANSTAYYSPRACEVIQRRLAADFEAFGYNSTCPVMS